MFVYQRTFVNFLDLLVKEWKFIIDINVSNEKLSNSASLIFITGYK